MLSQATLGAVMGILPDPFTGTVTPALGSPAPFTVDGIRQRPATRKEIEWTASLGLGLAERVFMLPVANVASGYQFIQNDVIADAAAKKWNVLTAALEMQGTIWRCYCKAAP